MSPDERRASKRYSYRAIFSVTSNFIIVPNSTHVTQLSNADLPPLALCFVYATSIQLLLICRMWNAISRFLNKWMTRCTK